jgi:hypothetical protein
MPLAIIGLKVSAKNSKSMFMCSSVECRTELWITTNKSFENVAEFKYLWMTLTKN